ncbi:hypothetical protein [Clostridium tetani]|uniref:hypothetical protein n=1 Tax=Clostridium tetani TaxID=1513 RepID=UPI00102706B1|nr:hypothetical protein [Clostridium tetani]RXI74947.1 hypothetical protein DP127_01430 [Clostridium tetani]BDR74644.1 hypothetical protein K154306013_03040 [Clostridium tetani]
MDKEILELLKQIQEDNKEFRSEVNNKLDNITNKLEAVYEQTADLTEFKTEVNEKLDTIKDDLNNVEVITASNWKDIAKLKAIK